MEENKEVEFGNPIRGLLIASGTPLKSAHSRPISTIMNTDTREKNAVRQRSSGNDPEPAPFLGSEVDSVPTLSSDD